MRRIVERRTPPEFLILNAAKDVVLVSPGLETDTVLPGVRRALLRAAAEPTHGQMFEAIDETTVVRIVPMADEYVQHFVVFVERVGGRGSLREAAKRFHLTRRETEVLGLVVRSFTNAQIAETLVIAHATAGDHVKSLLRKIGCSRRSELIARVYDLDRGSPEINLV
jgi:DNA-binding CsgD family transcriptional regulator